MCVRVRVRVRVRVCVCVCVAVCASYTNAAEQAQGKENETRHGGGSITQMPSPTLHSQTSTVRSEFNSTVVTQYQMYGIIILIELH